jgi:hypothetical protein
MSNENESKQEDIMVSEDCYIAPEGCKWCDGINRFDGWELICKCPCHSNKSVVEEIGGDSNESLVKEGEKLKYTVRVDDNYHYMDESERYTLGVYETCEKAVRACKQIVDEFLVSGYKVGTTADELYRAYTTFGEDPFISSPDTNCKFSAWTYAKARCEELCG